MYECTESMDTPRMYFNNASRPSAPSSANRSTVSSRAGNRSSIIDYDSIPSPRPSTSSQRTRLNGTSTPKARVRSNLSQVVPSSAEEEDEEDKNDDSLGHVLGNNTDEFEPPPMEFDSPEQNRSFTEMEHEGDEQGLEPPRATISSPPSARRAGKAKRKEPTPDEDLVEDEIGRGLDEIENMANEEDGMNRKDKHKKEPPKAKPGRQAADSAKPSKRKKVTTELSGEGRFCYT